MSFSQRSWLEIIREFGLQLPTDQLCASVPFFMTWREKALLYQSVRGFQSQNLRKQLAR